MPKPAETRPVRVVLVDDHPLLREVTHSRLGRACGIEVVGAVGEGRAAIELVTAERPDILLLDIHLPDINGIAVARQVRASCPDTAILILTGLDDPTYFHALLPLGIRGYLSKSIPSEELVEAIKAIAAGQTLIRPTTVPIDCHGLAEILTEREMHVLKLLAQGQRNVEIAERMVVSVKTVEFHVSNILSKLRARSRTEAIVRAQEAGILAAQGW
ncbi:MAG: response regulator [Sphingomonadaceae bacterium]